MIFDIYINGEHVSSHKNLITDRGYDGLLRFVAGDSKRWIGAMSVGVGDTTPAATDRFLDFEINRQPIEATKVESEDGVVMFKATFPQDLIGEIREYGLHSLVENEEADGESKIISSFDPERDGFDGTFTETDVRVGLSGLTLDSTDTAKYENFQINLDKYKDTDLFIIAAIGSGELEIRFKVNESNYFHVTKTVPSGYSFVEMAKDDFSQVGTPNWENIKRLEFICNSGSVVLDAFSVRDVDEYEEYFLVSRAIATEPRQKAMNEELNIEYRVKLTVE